MKFGQKQRPPVETVVMDGKLALRIPVLVPGGVFAFALVDQEDEGLAKHCWRDGGQGYPHRKVTRGDRENGMHGKHVTLHHAVMGKPAADQEIDHKNRDRRDCRRSNLRFVTRLENARNRGADGRNTSGHTGVRFHLGRWEAYIVVHDKQLHLGRFDTMVEAITARQAGERKHWGVRE